MRKFVTCAFGIVFVAAMATIIFPEKSFAEQRKIDLPESIVETPEGGASLKRLQEVLKLIGDNYLRKLTDKELVELMLNGGLTEIDPHTHLFNPQASQRFQEQIHGSFGGLGIEIIKSKNPERPGIVVISPLDDTPAHRGGIQSRDLIVKINGISTRGMSMETALNSMRGVVGEPIVLTIFREGVAEPFDVRLVREVITIKDVKFELKENGIGYIRLMSFSETACMKVTDAISSLVKSNNAKPLTGLVLDLRGNPGGLLGVSDCVSNQFLSMSQYRSRDEATTISKDSRGKRIVIAGVYNRHDILKGKPLMILINGGSASASEIVAGVLQIHGRATIAGVDKSFGKGTVQSVFPLSDGWNLKLTIAQYMLGSRGCEKPVQGVGITPDVLLKRMPSDPPASAEVYERTLPHSIGTAQEGTQCEYHFAVSAEHKTAAYDMLKVMGLEPLEVPSP